MSQETEADAEGVDFALAAYREEGVWQVQELAARRAARPRRPRRRAAPLPRRRRRARPGRRSTRTSSCSSGSLGADGPAAALRRHRRRRVGARPLGRRAPRPAAARRRGRPGARRRPRPRRRPRHGRRWTWARCSTTSTSTPTRCSPTSPAGSASAGCSTRPSALTTACERPTPARGTPAMRAALDEARAALATGDVPIGAVVLDAGRRRRRPRPQPSARPTPTRPRTPRWSRCAQAAAARGRVAARRLHARGHPRAVHDVRRRDRARPGRPAGVRRLRRRRPAPSARCGTWSATAGSTTGPRWSAACSPRSARGAAARFFDGHRDRPAEPRADFRGAATGPVPSSAVACPSGLRSTPRKRVRVQDLRGFKSHRHRQVMSPDIPNAPDPRFGAFSRHHLAGRAADALIPQRVPRSGATMAP